jgi:hypothetical protein
MNLSELVKRGISNPLKLRKIITHQEVRHSLSRELNKLYHSRGGRRRWNPDGIDIFAEDWDNLIILDACRHDAMRKAISRHSLNWELDSRISRGSQTPEWLYANFHNRQLHDTVYVTATTMPHYLGVQEPTTPRQHEYGFILDVHDLINVWADPPEDAMETYVDRAETELVLPAKSIIEPAIKAAKDYPNKRIIVHIVQPHDPYLGKTGEELHKRSASPWHDKLNGNLDVQTKKLRRAYRENVDLAVDAANTIVDRLPGKTVVSSDHGEFLYEKSGPIPTIEILHPDKTYTDTLVKVPWVEVDSKNRREIIPESPVYKRGDGPRSEETHDQLEALGYR